MADALISPAVGGVLWVATGGVLALCARRVKQTVRDNLVPLMGVLGAFVFVAQMINFSIPGTGSSGHLGGGLLLAVLLGPHAAFLVIASVLTVQAFFFADGGLLSLGCNIINLGFFPAFVAYPLIYRVIGRDRYATARAWVAAIVAAVVGLQLGALGVILETAFSGIASLPLRAFALLMLPIHAAIGVVEGVATAAVVAFVARARPEAFPTASAPEAARSLRPLLVALLLAVLVLGGVLSWFASAHPDGLEWAIARVSGRGELVGQESCARTGLSGLQERTAFLPDYGFRVPPTGAEHAGEPSAPQPEPWPAVRVGTSVSGLVGGLLTLGLAGLVGYGLKARLARHTPREGPDGGRAP